MKRLYENYLMTITPLTPIHIGSGEVIMPGDYFLFQEKGSYALYAVDMGYLGSRLAKGRDTLCKWILDDPVGWVKKAIEKENFTTLVKKYARFRSVVSDRVGGEIKNRWGEGTSMLEISTFERSGQNPIVPGSSIKGAIRTALLYQAVKKPLQIPNTRQKNGVSRWERETLGSKSGDVQDDILRHLKVSDATAKGVQTVVLNVEHVGMRTQSGKQAQLVDYRECLPGILQPDAEDYTVQATLQIWFGHPHYSFCRGKLTKEHILQSCRQFYGTVLEADMQYWRGDNELEELYAELKKRLQANPHSALIRLGWGCGMDSTGLNLVKPTGKHPPRKIDYKFRYNPQTRRIFDGLYPPGWAVFTLEAT